MVYRDKEKKEEKEGRNGIKSIHNKLNEVYLIVKVTLEHRLT